MKCAGYLREFNHRIKSISASTFTDDEILLLKKWGNAKNCGKWLATWSPTDFPKPYSNDPKKVRQFMKQKYILKEFYWECSPDSNSASVDPFDAKPTDIPRKIPNYIQAPNFNSIDFSRFDAPLKPDESKSELKKLHSTSFDIFAIQENKTLVKSNPFEELHGLNMDKTFMISPPITKFNSDFDISKLDFQPQMSHVENLQFVGHQLFNENTQVNLEIKDTLKVEETEYSANVETLIKETNPMESQKSDSTIEDMSDDPEILEPWTKIDPIKQSPDPIGFQNVWNDVL